MVTAAEDALGQKLDRCLTDAAIKFGHYAVNLYHYQMSHGFVRV